MAKRATEVTTTTTTEWRCDGCGALAGTIDGEDLYIEKKGWRYRVALPASVTCPRCGTTTGAEPAARSAA
jgi:hypothetical protein